MVVPMAGVNREGTGSWRPLGQEEVSRGLEEVWNPFREGGMGDGLLRRVSASRPGGGEGRRGCKPFQCLCFPTASPLAGGAPAGGTGGLLVSVRRLS